MTRPLPREYEQLTPEQAARVDAVCDDFERAWQAVPKGGAVPQLDRFQDRCDGPERAVLVRELIELDRACRERYGVLEATDNRRMPRPAAVAAPDAPPALAPLGRFTLLRELGRGGFGVVYLAHDPHLGREVALKVLHRQAVADPDARARFQREARAAAGLQHPNLVPVYEAGEVGSVAFIVLAYCPGISLADWLRQRTEPVPPGDAARLVATLADAVEHAHRYGVVHRDLKPANVLLSEASGPAAEEGPGPRSGAPALRSLAGYQPRITDFGLAKHLHAPAAQTQTGTVIGTPSYMAPEQTGLRESRIGPAADVYGLGGLLYELLTGRAAFLGETAADTLLQVRNQAPIPPRQLRPGLPRELDTVCLKCLEKEPRRRYASARELADDLGRFLEGRPIHARPLGAWGRLGKWARRRPAVTALLVSLVLVTAAGLAGIYAKYRDAEEEKHRAQQESIEKAKALDVANQARYGLQMNLAQREWENNDLAAARRYLAATDSWRRGWEYGYLSRLCNSRLPQAQTIRGEDGSAGVGLLFLPGSRRLLSVSGAGPGCFWDHQRGILAGRLDDPGSAAVACHPERPFLATATANLPGKREGDLRFHDTSGKELRVVRQPHTRGVTSLAFRADGRLLALGSTDGKVYLCDPEQAGVRRVLAGHEHPVRCVAFAPFGNRLATAGADRTIRLWDSDTGERLRVFWGHTDEVLHLAFSSPDGTHLASAGADCLIKLWDVSDTRGDPHPETLRGHGEAVTGVAFDREARRLASGSRDGTVRLWDVHTAQEVLCLRRHTSPVLSVTFSPDGRWLASGAADGTIHLWDGAAP